MLPSPLPAATRLSPLDLALVALYLIAITLFGLRFRKSGKQSSSLKSYFLADNTIPWWAIALSIVSAETSTLTIISIPGVAFAGDLGFLQVVLGYMLGRVVVALLFLPRYFRGEMLTAYQLIDQRFGHSLHKITAGLFLLTRAAAEGVRVFAISIVVSIAIGTGDTLSIAIISALTLLYTFEGGMAAVIWTDVVQMALYVIGTLIAVATLGSHVPGGWTHIVAAATPLGKFHMFNFALNLTTTYTFWAGVLGGTFLTMASHGTDQLMVQRMLAARNLRESRLALLSSGVVIFFQFTLFLLIGVGLFVFYGIGGVDQYDLRKWSHTVSPDRLFPSFIVQQMPHGVAGLLVAAILAAAMSNLSAALNSLASTTVIDFYVPFRTWQQKRVPHVSTLRHGIEPPQTPSDGRSNTLVSRLSTVVWALILFAIAVYAIQHGGKGHVVETGLSIASVAYGCLLGVFLLGTLTRYATQLGTSLGMLCGFLLNLYLWKETTIAFTWYVLIGSLATFALGSLFSILLPKPRRALTALLLLSLMCLPQGICVSSAQAQQPAPTGSSSLTTGHSPLPYDFSEVSTLITEAIAKHQLPGAVVLIGHNGQVVFHHAYGLRKLAGEPGLDGKPSPAEPMTEDTIFDMASLTKVIVTTTAILQLYEQHKLDLDAPVAKYLPDFASADLLSSFREAGGSASRPSAAQLAWKSQITIRELLTHYSGLPEDVNLKDDWGLKAPDKAEGIRRALAAIPYGPPGQTFKYSDINFITLGALVERVSGDQLDVYADKHLFQPLAMKETAFRPVGTCNQYQQVLPIAGMCADLALRRIAPTAHDDESKSDPGRNPRFDALLRGVVNDPTTRRMGGVAGHAGVFSTAADASRFCDALLAKLLRNTGPFPLPQATLRLATTPNEPATAVHTATIFTPDGQTTTGVASRGLGWDLNSPYSRPRGSIFPISTRENPGSFGHTGFTGTSLWLDPVSDTYVILLANAIHPRGAPPISTLRGQVATAAARALGLTQTARAGSTTATTSAPRLASETWASSEARPSSPPNYDPSHPCCDTFGDSPDDHLDPEMLESGIARVSFPATAPAAGFSPHPVRSASPSPTPVPTLTGIDVLESTQFAALANFQHIGLVANQSSIDSHSRRTIDILAHTGKLITLFTPEHGLSARQDTEHLAAEQDPATHLPILSLYGPRLSDKHARQSDLKKLDALVIDLPDAGVRFWTYETLVGYLLEDCARARIPLILLDRPNPIGGLAVQGPSSDLGSESYIDFMSIPVRHGMTLGELARFFNDNATQVQLKPELVDGRGVHIGNDLDTDAAGITDKPPATQPGLHAQLTVIRMQNWRRAEYFADTGLPWIPPSPNMRTPATNIVYPAVALIETTNMSVGRGSPAPYENFGAPFIQPAELAAYLTARNIPGVTFSATTLPIANTAEKYPFHGQTIPAIHLTVTDRTALNTPELGIEILAALHHLYPADFQLEKAHTILLNADTLAAIKAGRDPRDIASTWLPSLTAFRTLRSHYLLYE